MFTISAAKKVLALICAASLLAAAPLAFAGDQGYLGVVLQNISPSMAKALQIEEGAGILVSEVVDDSPAAAVGLQAGDVILAFGGVELAGDGDLTKAVRAAKPGDDVDLVILRGGNQRTLTVEVGEREDSFTWVGGGDDDKNVHIYSFQDGDDDFDFDTEDHNVFIKRIGDDDEIKIIMRGMHEDRGFLGVHLDDLNEQMGEYFGVDDGQGALITEVIEDTPAAKAGLKAGDVIVKLGDDGIGSAAAVHKALAGTEAGQEIKVEVKRHGKGKNMDVTLGEMPEDAFARQLKIISEGDEFHIMAPKMMHNMPHMKHQMQMHGAHRVEMHELRMTDEELKEMREDLEEMREELEEMREEIHKK